MKKLTILFLVSVMTCVASHLCDVYYCAKGWEQCSQCGDYRSLGSLNSRYNIIYDFSRSFKLRFPNKESEIVEKYFSKATPELQKEYIMLISKSKHSSAKKHLAVFLSNNPQFKQ